MKYKNLYIIGNGFDQHHNINCSYNNFIEALEERNEGKNPRGWFTYHSDVTNGVYYTADVVKSDFDKWIADGMKDN